MLAQFLVVFLVSMLPLVELRGAIPVAVGMGLPEIWSYVVAIIGNMLPVPVIFLFARRVLVWGQNKKYIGKFFRWCLKKGEKGGAKLLKRGGVGVYIALFLFVGVPIPGTGAWTGTLAASILDLDFKQTMVAVLGGVLMAGILMLLVSVGVFAFL